MEEPIVPPDRPVFPCNLCRPIKNFYRETNLASHLLRHQLGFDCYICGKPNTTRDNLNIHLEVSHAQPVNVSTVEGGRPSNLHDTKFVPSWQIDDHHQRRIAKYRVNKHFYKVSITNRDRFEPTSENLNTLFTDLVSTITAGVPKSHSVGLTLTTPSLDYPIVLPYVRLENFSGSDILTQIERSLNSNEDFCIDNRLTINLDHVEIPEGRGDDGNDGSDDDDSTPEDSNCLAPWRRNRCKPVSVFRNLDAAYQQKRGVIQIRNADNLCLARALATAIERHKALEINPPAANCYRAYRNANSLTRRPKEEKLLLEGATFLQNLAGIPLDKESCGIAELQRFQSVLPSYCIRVFTASSKQEILYRGPPTAENNIFLIYDEHKKHFNVISGPLAFFAYKYYCTQCDKGYEARTSHSCELKCSQCHAEHTRSGANEHIPCDKCGRTFYDKQCFANHEEEDAKVGKKPICDTIRKCLSCGVIGRVAGHRCGTRCRLCHVYYTDSEDHSCYVSAKKVKNDARQQYIFFDIESQFIDTPDEKSVSQHMPILVIAHRVCGRCADKIFDTSQRTNCSRCTPHIFKGESCIKEFIEWLFNGDNFYSTVIAHNFKGYDGIFILKKLHELGKSPEFTTRGSQILEITIKAAKIRFIDSLSFLLKPLSKLPKMFGLTTLKKGFFPYSFCTPSNLNYVGKFPAKEYFCPESMKGSYSEKTGELIGDVKAFEIWYNDNKNTVFDMQKELIEYCTSDVVILKQACLHFRKSFMNDADIDPLLANVTISQLCMDYFRSHHLKENTIAIIPANGYYNEERQSKIGLKWLKYIEKTRGLSLVYKGSKGEKRVGKYRVDGYDPDSNRVFEFLGSYWHGDPKIYSAEFVNKTVGKTMGQIYTETMDRINYIRAQGYAVEYIWESEFLNNPEAADFIKTCEVIGPLEPRDAFYGGRTNCAWLKRECEQNEKIRYVDFCSLYPKVNKYGKYPLGHPTIITKDFGDLSIYYGLVKCRILPPRDLYLPVLPSRFSNGKLVFALCGICANKCIQAECTHSDTERALLGTWATPELDEAVMKGYTILEVYEVWHFQKSAQLNLETGERGLFSDYIDKFFKAKLQHSGWPPDCITDEEKDSFIMKVFQREGIQLEKTSIAYNEGRRQMDKIMLNSFWGKWGQKNNLSKKVLVRSRAHFLTLMCDDTLIIESAVEQSPETLLLTYKLKADLVEAGPASNIIIACFTTALARLELYKLISALDKRALYWDTDSCFYVETDNPNEFRPQTGTFLGDLTNELPPGRHITAFYSGGPKNYCYIMDDFDSQGTRSKCVIKGVSMNFSNCHIINPKMISSKIEKYILEGDSSRLSVYKTDKFFSRGPDLTIFMINYEKRYRILYDKRRYFRDYSTAPYGYRKKMWRPWE